MIIEYFYREEGKILMKKNTLKIAAVLSGLAVCLTAFAACSSEKNEDKLIYKEGGKIYYRPQQGDIARELATDKNGVTLVDSEGNLLWKVTNADGEDQTHPVSYPAVLNEGDRISCQQFSIKLPRGWEKMKSNNAVMLKNEKDSAQIDYSFFENKEDEVNTAESRVQALNEMLQPSVKDGTAIIEVEDVQVSGRDAKKIVIKTSGKNSGKKDAYLEVYFIDTANGVMSFSCSCPAEDGGKYDFKAVLDTIEYRI